MNYQEKTNSHKLIFAKADKISDASLLVLFTVGLLLSFLYNTFMVAIGVGGVCLLAYYLTKKLINGSGVYQYILSAAYALFSAQFVYQTKGMPEMYFAVFVTSVLLIAYQNWKLQLPLAIITTVCYLAFAYLLNGSAANYAPIYSFLFHMLFSFAVFGLSGYWSYLLNKKTSIIQNKETELEEQSKRVSQNIEFAEEISKGNLEKEYTLNQGDLLGSSLLKMRENLKVAYLKDQQDKFVNLGLAKASEILRLESNNLEDLANSIISFLVKYLEANQGGLFVVNTTDADEVYLEMKSCYAFNRKKYIEKRIEKGEGLVGQVYLEGETIYLTEVPENYIAITSGLGTSNPRCIVLVPLKVNDVIYGVVEIASFTVLEKYKVDFIERVGESIATAISNTQVNEKTQKLLHESQMQAEMLRSQEEEMRQNMEELAATQEEMERKAAEMELIRDEEKRRADTQIEAQKKLMEQYVAKTKEKEHELLAKIKELEKKVMAS